MWRVPTGLIVQALCFMYCNLCSDFKLLFIVTTERHYSCGRTEQHGYKDKVDLLKINTATWQQHKTMQVFDKGAHSNNK